MAAPEASASWGSQLDLAAVPPQEEDVLELDYRDDEDGTSELLISEDEEEDELRPPDPATRGRNCPWPRVRRSKFSPSSQSC